MIIHFARFIAPPPKDQVRRLFARPRRYREVLVLLQKMKSVSRATGLPALVRRPN